MQYYAMTLQLKRSAEVYMVQSTTEGKRRNVRKGLMIGGVNNERNTHITEGYWCD